RPHAFFSYANGDHRHLHSFPTRRSSDLHTPSPKVARTSGCYELFGNDRVRAIRDLKGKTVAIQYFGGGDHILLSSMLAYVGMNPDRKSTRLNSSHVAISYAVFCLKKKKT